MPPYVKQADKQMTKPHAENYTAMIRELETLLADMQAENLDVDVALTKYEHGQRLITDLEKYLEAAENKIIQYKPNQNEDSK
jgi:exodeoxyribonuclease VII small subunit